VSTIALHHNEFAFPSADVFDPNRWLGGSYEEYRAMCRCFAPFGYGSRICLGRFFAELQIKILTAGLCLKYHLRIGHDLIVMEKTMRQTGTMDAVPVGLRCDLILTPRGISTLQGFGSLDVRGSASNDVGEMSSYKLMKMAILNEE
jgi:cytochrome P450